MPHARLLTQAGDAEAYLAEARTVASLDHANIVPVYDVGSTDQFPCFIVLFDTDHARKVLAAFGRAFGKLPENPGATSKDHKQFLEQASGGTIFETQLRKE